MMTANVIKIKRNLLTGLSQSVAGGAGGSTKAASEIWNHFTKVGNNLVRCSHCFLEMSQGANSTTKTMWCHLMYRHKQDVYFGTRHYYIKQLQKNSLKRAKNIARMKGNGSGVSDVQEASADSEDFNKNDGYESNDEHFDEDEDEDEEEDYEQYDTLAHFAATNNSADKDEEDGHHLNNSLIYSQSIGNVKQESDLSSSPKPTEMFEISGSGVVLKDGKDILNLKIIQEVSNHPALYDHRHRGYKSNDVRIKEWDAVAQATEQSVEFARTRWKTLRDRYKKECRKQEQRAEPSQWLHFEDMQFLAPFVRDKPIGPDESLAFDDSYPLDLDAFGSNTKHGQPTHQVKTDSSNTNYILDFAMNVVASGNGDRSGDEESPASASSNYDDSLTPQFQRGGRKQQEPPAATVTTTFDRPFKFDEYYEAEKSHNQHHQHPSSSSTQQQQWQLAAAASRKRHLDQYGFNDARELGSRDKAQPLNRREQGYFGGCTWPAFSQDRRFNNTSNQLNNQVNRHNPASFLNKNGPKNSFGQAPSRPGLVDEEEDELFCRIMLKKMRKMNEHTKERAKAKILDLLVQFQYGVIS